MTEADAFLEGLEPLGARFGLERIEALTAELRRPQDGYAIAHVVGTNGKSSVARAIEALLGAHGVRAGAYLSPHLESWRERVTVAGEPISASAMDAAVSAVALVAGRLEIDEPVTQFEAATAAAFVALAEAGVEAAAIEAGLGGRLDATNVVASRVTVLTSVGLEHTEWLGEDETAIAAEKLAVLREGTALVLGEVSPGVERLAHEIAAQRSARVIDRPRLPPSIITGPYRRRNLAVAVAAARELLALLGLRFELEDEELGDLARAVAGPGRLELLSGDVEAVLDVAHNADGAAALAESLPEVAGSEPLLGCVALLADKEAEGFAGALAPRLEQVVCTEVDPVQLRRSARPGAAAMPAEQLAHAFRRAGVAARTEGEPAAALTRARSLAAGGGRTILVTGSHHLVAAARRSWLCDD